MKSWITLVLALVGAGSFGCMAESGSVKTANDEAALVFAEGDEPADSYTRRLDLRGTVNFGETKDGSFSSSGYAGYLFTGSRGARLTVTLDSDDADPVLALYGPQTTRSRWSARRPIATNDDATRRTLNSRIDIRLPESGTYLLLAREYWGAEGSFSLSLACTGAECRAECGADDSCPTGSSCERVYCVRAPCPSFCAAVDPTAPAACTDAECGPRPRSPTFLCDDGSVGGNTGRCFRGPDLMCGWEHRVCPVTQACGSRGLGPCPATQFCDFPLESTCGATDRPGVCRAVPEICTREFMPVCGCDGATYSNACNAAAAGVSVASEGPCGAPRE
jgi:hypothetical protein